MRHTSHLVKTVSASSKKAADKTRPIRGGYLSSSLVVGWVLSIASLHFGCDAIHRIAPGASATKTVEAAVFEGGYGIDWHTKMATRFTELHSGDRVSVRVWGDPRVGEIVKPRLLRGDPPDLILDNRLPIWLLISTNKLHTFDAALDAPAFGSKDRWRDLFVPGTLDTYTCNGSVYAIPTSYGAWGCWYNAKLFREHGWRVPSTWLEFTSLCDSIQKSGISPIAYQGKYPEYSWNTYLSLLQRCGGLVAVNRVNGREPGAFSHPDAVRAAALLQEIATKYFQRGAMAMTHTESQLEFVNNKAALIFCGVWLENEMKNSTPPDFEMRCFNVPAVEGGKGNPRLFNGQGMEYVFVPSSARYPDEAIDFCKYMTSLENAPDMGRSIGVISPLTNATPMDAVSPALQSVLEMIHGAPGIFSDLVTTLLLEWKNQVLNPALAELLNGEITPQEFGEVVDRGVAAAVANAEITLPNYTPYDPAKFGETP